MATFKAIAKKHHLKADGTVKIKIRVTHNRKTKYIDTGLTATKEDLTRSFRIKNVGFLDDTDKTISRYRTLCNDNREKVAGMNCDQLVEFLMDSEKVSTIDFLKFGYYHAEKLKSEGRTTTANNYNAALNCLKRYTGKDTIDISEITAKFLQGFTDWIPLHSMKKKNLKPSHMTRAQSHYLESIRALHNEMKDRFNDEDMGIIRIPYSPFSKFKIPARIATKKRAVSPEMIKKIYSLPDVEVKPGRKTSTYNLGKDCFVLSFCFIGMNSADLYECLPPVEGFISYYRKKTRTRRKDKAEIKIKVPDKILPLIKKWKDKTGKRLFKFYKEYSNESNFNKAINKGLKKIEPDLDFYAARHSWATIALNKAGIDKYTVHSALNHVDEAMRVTDIYIEKDFTAINEANRKVIDLVLKENPATNSNRAEESHAQTHNANIGPK